VTADRSDGAARLADLYGRAAVPRPSRRFTILLPIVRPPLTLPYAVRSVLVQSERDFELCIVCDGAPVETVAAAEDLAAGDDRIRVFAFPKGARHGEAHRAAVLAGSTARFVAQTGDDDLWLPNHLAALGALLEKADFATLPQLRIYPGGKIRHRHRGNLADPDIRKRMLTERWNFFGPTEAGYRLSAYRGLETGWGPAPADLPTDLFMWRKFLRDDRLRFVTGFTASSLKFGADNWDALPAEKRAGPIAAYAARLDSPFVRWRAQWAVSRRGPKR
jgi:glycosyltransferase involved in cell wall biosynthesis